MKHLKVKGKGLNADAAFMLAIKFSLSAQMIYDWAEKHGHNLLRLAPEFDKNQSLFIGCVLSDNPYEGMLFARKAPWIDPKKGYLFER